ncbi:sulfotransferase domain-containing protein [Pyxidicoccus caerfyrddinensis]|uniref:sulfotransferase domain-containing protein n=1 Tax=Pyxidicoccus caerfyrddinensis TaxID=2709663 RepID=UPI0013DC077F|nr:sulfotransferase domain-containing protein [Pyxidicoccus caerfyrddinensis]
MRWLTKPFLMFVSGVVFISGLVFNTSRTLREFIRFRTGFRPRPDDIFIATYPKSGTTWMQMLLVQLLGKGDVDFDHILQKSPYLEELIRNENLDYMEKMPSPRMFKTHLRYGDLKPAKSARIIFVTRDARDTFISCYHHYEMLRRFRSPFDRFMKRMVSGNGFFGSWYGYMRSWMPHRHDANVLWLRYEDLRGDLEGQVRRVAAFLGVPVPEERMSDLLEKCSFEYMKQHNHKFDFRMGLYGEDPGAFIRQGGTKPRQPIREEHVAELEKNLAKLRGDLKLKDTETF